MSTDFETHWLNLTHNKGILFSIEAVGLYVPGGTAVLPSSALMLTIPAKIAGLA